MKRKLLGFLSISLISATLFVGCGDASSSSSHESRSSRNNEDEEARREEEKKSQEMKEIKDGYDRAFSDIKDGIMRMTYGDVQIGSSFLTDYYYSCADTENDICYSFGSISSADSNRLWNAMMQNYKYDLSISEDGDGYRVTARITNRQAVEGMTYAMTDFLENSGILDRNTTSDILNGVNDTVQTYSETKDLLGGGWIGTAAGVINGAITAKNAYSISGLSDGSNASGIVSYFEKDINNASTRTATISFMAEKVDGFWCFPNEAHAEFTDLQGETQGETFQGDIAAMYYYQFFCGLL